MAWTRVRLGRDTRKGGLIIRESEEALNDSDKLYTVGTGEKVEVLAIHIELIATATVGNRQPQIDVQDAAANDVVLTLGSDTVRAASGTQIWVFVKGGEGSLVPVAGTVIESLPEDLILGAGEDLRIFDSAAVDAAADDMTVHLLLRVF